MKTRGAFFLLALCVVQVCAVDRNFGTVRGALPSSDCSVLSSELQFMGSSQRDSVAYPYTQATLDHERGWLSNSDTPGKPWLMLDMGTVKTIYGVVTQGRTDWLNDFAEKYRVEFCFEDSSQWCTSGNWGTYPKEFVGNTDNTNRATNVFDNNGVTSRTVRIVATQWIPGAAVGMRAGVLLCNNVPPVDYNAQFGNIVGGGPPPHGSACKAISLEATHEASSYDAPYYNPNEATLDNFVGWMKQWDDSSPFLKIDFGEPKMVYGVVTQGRPDWDDWVEEYTLEYCVDEDPMCRSASSKWWPITKTFQGNTDRSSRVTNLVQWYGFPARVLKIIPTRWHGNVAMRVGIITCSDVNVPQGVTLHNADCRTKGDASPQFDGCVSNQPCFVHCTVNQSDPWLNCRNDGKPLWGTYLYTHDTPPCRAAYHIAGKNYASAKAILMYFDRDRQLSYYAPSTRYGIDSLEFVQPWPPMSLFPSELGFPMP